jgi:hypothetical protein
LTLEIHVLIYHRHTNVVGLNRLMRTNPSFDNLCMFKSYRDRNLQIDHKCSTECCIALYICGVNIWQLYTSNFLMDIYFVGFIKRKKNIGGGGFLRGFCVFFLVVIIFWTHCSKLIILTWDNWFHYYIIMILLTGILNLSVFVQIVLLFSNKTDTDDYSMSI